MAKPTQVDPAIDRIFYVVPPLCGVATVASGVWLALSIANGWLFNIIPSVLGLFGFAATGLIARHVRRLMERQLAAKRLSERARH